MYFPPNRDIPNNEKIKINITKRINKQANDPIDVAITFIMTCIVLSDFINLATLNTLSVLSILIVLNILNDLKAAIADPLERANYTMDIITTAISIQLY